MSDRGDDPLADHPARPWFGGRAWPWVALGLIAWILVGALADGFDWPTWVRGSLLGLCAGGGGALAGRAWRRRFGGSARPGP